MSKVKNQKGIKSPQITINEKDVLGTGWVLLQDRDFLISYSEVHIIFLQVGNTHPAVIAFALDFNITAVGKNIHKAFDSLCESLYDFFHESLKNKNIFK